MTLTETFALVSFSLFSYADLRYRLVPGIEIFLFGTILLTFPATPIQTGIVLLACGWSIFRNLSGWFALPGTAYRLWISQRHYWQSRPACDQWAGLSLSSTCRAVISSGIGTLAQTLGTQTKRRHPGFAGSVVGIDCLSPLAFIPTNSIATRTTIPH
jgi:hypothetical protein